MRRVVTLAAVLAAGMMFAAGCGGGGNKSTTSQLRVVNSVSDSPGFDILADSSSFATAVGFGSATAYSSVASGSHTMEVRNTGTTADLLSQSITLSGGDNYSYVIGGADAAPATILLTDNTAAQTTGNVQIRIVNTAVNFGAMDVYIVPYGTRISSVTANVANLQPGSSGGYQTFKTGSYDILVAKPGENNVVYLETGTINFADTGSYTILIDGTTSPGGFPLNPISLTDVAGTAS